MSRFFRAGDSSSDEESSSSGSGSSSEDERPQQAKGAAQQKETGAKFTRGTSADSSSSEDEGPRVVKSAKEKRLEEFVDAVKATRSHLNGGDWGAVLTDFEKLLKLQAKGGTGSTFPPYFVRVIVDIDDKVTEVVGNKEETRKLKAVAAKALTALKNRLRKYTKEEDVEKVISEYRANPDAFASAEAAAFSSLSKGGDDDAESDSDESDSDESDSDDDAKKKKGAAKFAKSPPAAAPAAAAVPSKFAKSSVPSKFAKKGSDSESSDDDGDDDDDEDWSDSDSDSDDGGAAAKKGASGASKWLKKDTSKTPAAAAAKPKAAEKPKTVVKKDDEETAARKPAAAAAPRMELTEEGVEGKLKEIIAMRGKKGTDRKDQIVQLQTLLEFTKSPLKQAQVLVNLTSAQFDINAGLDSHMSAEMWRRCYSNIDRLLSIVTTNADVVLNEEGVGDVAAEDSAAEEQPAVMGNLLSFLERLDDELYKSLQTMDAHNADYARRLQDSNVLLKLAEGVHDYYIGIGNAHAAARASMRRLEHLYFVPDDLAARAAGKTPDASSGTSESPSARLIDSLCREIYKHGDDRTKTRALLCQVYYHAIHNRFTQGRDLLLMSHLQETVHQTDEPTIILYNRTTAQLGLSAFRAGLIHEAHLCLGDVCGSGKTKELLAQGISIRHDRSADQERFEKRRVVPYHLHIDLDLLECCHLVSAMLIEVPNMAANAHDTKLKVISKPLRRLFEHYERQVLVGPPESMRETLMTAARALRQGDWKQCAELVLGLEVWHRMSRASDIKPLLRRKIQEEGLRTYLFTFSAHYDAMSVTQLCQIFELSQQQVHSIVSRMITGGELHASWDQATNSLVMHHVEPSRLQFFALQFAEKAALFVENNERVAEAKFGAITSSKDRHPFFMHGGQQSGGAQGQQSSQQHHHHQQQQGGGNQGGRYGRGGHHHHRQQQQQHSGRRGGR